MTIDFKSLEIWLHKQLKPLCVADPIPLSQYVIALIKKDKPENELKDICVDQLEVFLQENTVGFVNSLFIALKNRSYVELDDVAAASKPTIQVGMKRGAVVDSGHLENRDKRRHPIDSVFFKSDSTESKQRRKRSSSRKAKSVHSRSRSRSPTSTARPPYGRKIGDEEPIPEDTVQHRGRTEKIERSGSRINSGVVHRDSYDRRSRQRDPDASRDRTTRERHRTPERESCGIRIRSSLDDRPDTEGYRRRRCRNFDERGFCVFGSRCPFDHGPNALVLPSAQAAAAAITQLSAPTVGDSGSLVPSGLAVASTKSLPLGNGQLKSVVTTILSDTVDSLPPSSASNIATGNNFPPLPVYRPTPIIPPTNVSNALFHPVDGALKPGLLSTPPPTLDTITWSNSGPLTPSHFLGVRNFRNPIGVNLVRHNVVPVPMVLDESSTKQSISVDHVPLAYEPDKPQISMVFSGPSTPLTGDTWSVNADPPLTYTPSPISDRPLNAAVTRPSDTTDSSFPEVLYVSRIPWRLNNEMKLLEHFSKFGTLIRVIPRYMGMPDTALLEFSCPDEAERTFRSPEPILSNRFIRLSTSLQSKFGNNRRDSRNVHDTRTKPLSERLGRKPILSIGKYDWLKHSVDTPADSTSNNLPSRIESHLTKGGRSRWRLERNAVTDDAGSGEEECERDLEGELPDNENDRFRKRPGYIVDGAVDLDIKRDFSNTSNDATDYPVLSRNRLQSKSFHDSKKDTAAYIWQKQKALALKQREEQLKLLDKSREERRILLDAQKQRVIRLQSQLKVIMSQLGAKTMPSVQSPARSSSEASPETRLSDRQQLLNEAKRIQKELEISLGEEKKYLLSKGASSTVGSTPISAAALQALPEHLATARLQQIAEVRATLKQVESDLEILKSKAEPLGNHRRRILELKRQLVHLETVRPSDFTETHTVTSGGHVDSTDPSGPFFPGRLQTKLDKRPRTVFVSGLNHQDSGPFQRALATNYLHTQRVIKHSDPNTDQLVLEITFCTRDFAEAAMRQFHQFHGYPISMSFSPPPLAQSVPTSTSVDGSFPSVVSSTQSELHADPDRFEGSDPVTSYSTHSSPTSTTAPTTES